MLILPRVPLLETCLALAIGGMAAVGCGREAPSGPPMATRIATLDAVNSARGLVDSLALSPDAGLVATGERGGQIRVWATAGEPAPVSLGGLPASRHRPGVSRPTAACSRRSDAIARARYGSGDPTTGPARRVGGGGIAARGPLSRAAFRRRGARLGVLCESEVLILDVASLQEVLRVPNPHREVLTAFDLSADGGRLMTAGHDGDVTVRDAATAAPRAATFSVRKSRRPDPPPRGMEPPEVWAVVVALSSDGARAAAVTIEGTVYVWDVATGKQLFDHADRERGRPAARLASIRTRRPPDRAPWATATVSGASTCRARRRGP
jgi:WD40 repeat protein